MLSFGISIGGVQIHITVWHLKLFKLIPSEIKLNVAMNKQLVKCCGEV